MAYAMKPSKPGLEESQEQIHKIRITLSSKNGKNLEKEMVKLVEGVVRSEHIRLPRRPVYLVGESLGACLALPVASHNPDIDLALILSNPEMVKLVEGVVRSEHIRLPRRPVYLVGESLGACLALPVASHNPDIDLALILSNPDGRQWGSNCTCYITVPNFNRTILDLHIRGSKS